MGWFFLAVAILCEILGTISLKLSAGMTRLLPTLAVVPLYGTSFVFLGLALKTVPLSVAYAVWSAVGIAVLAAVGMLWLREPAGAMKIVALIFIVFGVVILYLGDSGVRGQASGVDLGRT